MKHFFVIGINIYIFAAWTLALKDTDTKYTNVWIVKIEGGEEVAERVASVLEYTYKGQFSSFENYYELVKEDRPSVFFRNEEHLTKSLLKINEVKWAKQQKVMKIAYKDFLEAEVEKDGKKLVTYIRQQSKIISKDATNKEESNIFGCIRMPFSFRNLFKNVRQGNIANLGMYSTSPAPESQLSKYKGTTKNIELFPWKISAYVVQFDDPLWGKQWYFQDYRTTDIPVMDHNVVPVYRMGYTGEGVTIAVVDTHLDVYHPDLNKNIDMENSYDICLDLPLEVLLIDYIPEPHGTISAGVIAMVANNNECGVGVAYNAKVAAINNHCNEDKPESLFAKSIIQNFENIDIHSNSWGFEDDPQEVFEFDEIMHQAYKKGVTEGRQGKGIIYVHSAGNGGGFDVCAADPVVNNPNIIAVTSANQYGKLSDYGERCSGVFATTYSGGTDRKNKIGVVSLNVGDECVESAVGTSASAPLASGMIALMLQANPELTYRDVMHIIARTAEVAPLANNDSWYRNGMGFWVSNEFGFGLMNAENMINVAKTWETVPPRHTCSFTVKPEYNMLAINSKVIVPFTTDGCQSFEDKFVQYLEHLVVASVVDFPIRGDIRVSIISPAKTRTVLLEPRPLDVNENGLEGWSIMSTHHWGEFPRGKWTIEVDIANRIRSRDKTGKVKEFKVTFHGIGARPSSLGVARDYAAFRLPNGKIEKGVSG